MLPWPLTCVVCERDVAVSSGLELWGRGVTVTSDLCCVCDRGVAVTTDLCCVWHRCSYYLWPVLCVIEALPWPLTCIVYDRGVAVTFDLCCWPLACVVHDRGAAVTSDVCCVWQRCCCSLWRWGADRHQWPASNSEVHVHHTTTRSSLTKPVSGSIKPSLETAVSLEGGGGQCEIWLTSLADSFSSFFPSCLSKHPTSYLFHVCFILSFLPFKTTNFLFVHDLFHTFLPFTNASFLFTVCFLPSFLWK